MTGILLGSLYIAALSTTYYVLWKREDNRVRREINQHLEELRVQQVGEK